MTWLPCATEHVQPDFSTRGPDGYFYMSGAYCGLFVSNSTSKPFMGVSYKVRSSRFQCYLLMPSDISGMLRGRTT